MKRRLIRHVVIQVCFAVTLMIAVPSPVPQHTTNATPATLTPNIPFKKHITCCVQSCGNFCEHCVALLVTSRESANQKLIHVSRSQNSRLCIQSLAVPDGEARGGAGLEDAGAAGKGHCEEGLGNKISVVC
ncbi:hypothetical protein E2C01_094077 [Portunus trituberculatus]|uniref:Uncharacterized protein n=1 Tax=Portunus trituberculatus TaxID=210409 RepID=A0A5B7JZV2_PORTR|nr:hypothetical protein [Portunus trituberculatus]